jgi:hypothetical protein
MISLKRRKFSIPFVERYFFDGSPSPCRASGIYIDIQSSIKSKLGFNLRTMTSVINLCLSDAEIFGRIKSNYRNEIRKSLKDDLVDLEWIATPSDIEIEGFCFAYDQFAKNVGIHACNKEKLRNFNQLGCLILTEARDSEVVFCRHVFISDGVRLRLYYSLSDFRNCSNESRAKIGRANKSLHWFEILKSKQLGFELYDFGGLSLDGKTDNIDRFKKSFGGYLVNEWRSYSFFL